MLLHQAVLHRATKCKCLFSLICLKQIWSRQMVGKTYSVLTHSECHKKPFVEQVRMSSSKDVLCSSCIHLFVHVPLLLIPVVFVTTDIHFKKEKKSHLNPSHELNLVTHKKEVQVPTNEILLVLTIGITKSAKKNQPKKKNPATISLPEKFCQHSLI